MCHHLSNSILKIKMTVQIFGTEQSGTEGSLLSVVNMSHKNDTLGKSSLSRQFPLIRNNADMG